MFDLSPATQEMVRLVGRVDDDQLGGPTPCSDWTVADLLSHVHQFATVFTHNARKEQGPVPDVLVDDWRAAIPARLDDLARAWADPSAWRGRVSAGGVEMDAADNAVVTIEELTVHGWDLARSTGQGFRADASCLDGVDRFLVLFGDAIDGDDGPFGAAVTVPRSATRWERSLARTGRDPWWGPAPRPPG